MAKPKQITIFDLLDKYLTSLGVPKSVLNIELLPSRYEDFYSYLLQNEHNLVAHNKKGQAAVKHIFQYQDVMVAEKYFIQMHNLPLPQKPTL